MAKKTKVALLAERKAAEHEMKLSGYGLKTYEFVQSATDGGHPVPSGQGFTHGDAVYVVSKRELMEFMAGVRPMIIDWVENQYTEAPPVAVEAIAIIDKVLANNQFMAPLRELGTPKEP